ncbi:hypothetical protein H7F15_00525 [Pontibacter sp. Tf4]|uniref:hypothetical protein n=1 Tax=Pontibacter sp. Tf4 TaxID=2761620 RepID=UPI00162727EB|nr:hypothetical protein [Pontibacter sp. Tf4]MBB6609508.1 hypothetical protein [Pontibacter sp. Tf4]
MIRLLIVLALHFIIFGCSGMKGSGQETITNSSKPASTLVEEKGDTVPGTENSYSIFSDPALKDHVVAAVPGNDFTLITERSGIFISPDTIEIERLKQEYGEEDFYTAADDNLYYEYEATEFLKKKGVKTIYPNTRYLKFKTGSGQEYFFDTKPAGSHKWYLILFDPSKDHPALISAINITEDYSKYFGTN